LEKKQAGDERRQQQISGKISSFYSSYGKIEGRGSGMKKRLQSQRLSEKK
jgi:hypothetical protein